jgi:transcription-repair coupling factor (superfamily II helicase)
MALRELLTYANENEELDRLVDATVDSAERAQRPGGRRTGSPERAFVSGSLRPFLTAALLDAEALAGRPALVVAADDRGARDLTLDLRAYLAPRSVRFFPARGVRYESQLAPPPHLVGLRVAALDALLDEEQPRRGDAPGAPVVVASAVALMERIPDPALRPHGFELAVAQSLDLDETLERLVACGYERTEQVADRGQFAVRGGILDVYPATEERAVRVELFGDEVESLRWFSTFTQRSLAEADSVEIAPAAELDPEYRELAELAASEEQDKRPDVAEILPLERFRSFLDLVPDRAVVVAAEEQLRPALSDHWQDITTSLHSEDAHQLYLPPDSVVEVLDRRVAVSLSAVSGDQPHAFRAQAADGAARSIREAETELEKLVRSGYQTVVGWGHRGEAERAAYNLARLRPTPLYSAEGDGQGGADGRTAPARRAPAAGMGAFRGRSLPSEGGPQPAAESDGKGALYFAHASLREGFVAPQLKLALIPDHLLLRRRPARADLPRARATLHAFTDLRAGDIVVHLDHGIGRFTGFDTKTVAGVTRDYLEVEYRDGDRVFVPTDQLGKLSRYVGANGHAPQLSKLGAKTWETMKARARRAAHELAGDLINLYAQRKASRGHGFGADSDWQHDFERTFPYRETDDQLEAIEQTKADMEEERPMDRLICGDVGYGKTEVALRAAFKAATDGKQVMFLVPTTILAQQHHGTVAERLRDYPFRIELLSRFRSAKDQRAVLADFAEGKVDILIGTHRLLSRDVRPRELGLVIVDEEQRFGVRQKDLLRQLRLRVDVLSLSATPIPRTLQMSLAGLRDISVIETPPEGRRPIHTYVGEYDEELVKAAIDRELRRGGQVFFLHDRVDTIEEVAEGLRGLCPAARIAVAHGQMEAARLERTMIDFLRGRSDVLVSTTIIESGLDIPQANTLVVEHADKLGLAQLYQIRGRVGRSHERAYAYLLYPSAASLSPEAAARLATLSDYTELGSGFKIALRDLEIRGAGNLLGEEQSGHVAAVGFELYCQMLDDAVEGLAGADAAQDGADGWEPVRLDVPVDAYIPVEYIPYEVAKIDVHRRIAAAREPAELAKLREELEDRFGPLPEAVDNLIKLQEARVKLGKVGARTVELRGGRVAIAPVSFDVAQARALREEVPEAVYESLKKTVRISVPQDPVERFPLLLHAADTLLRVA